ncbi:hypothetical protein [Cupriavidus sp. EM10]|uniref:hypothetical protein n=1 Tax=Cupriavidus sp. EM10 TaxID=2839983 RepID=UPI001C003507|nr:hypothetical protein [Cupriavidus sp. EM10]QWE95635.1 hypothetical protein KLP38_07285 [Cupriavidus sp. EM10]
MPATKSPQNFTGAERLIAMVVSKDGLNFANDNDIEAGAYLSAVADFVLRNKLDDAALASLGRQVFQQYLADVAHLVAETDREMSDAIERCEAEFRAHVGRTPNHLLPRNGGVL